MERSLSFPIKLESTITYQSGEVIEEVVFSDSTLTINDDLVNLKYTETNLTNNKLINREICYDKNSDSIYICSDSGRIHIKLGEETDSVYNMGEYEVPISIEGKSIFWDTDDLNIDFSYRLRYLPDEISNAEVRIKIQKN